MSIGSFDDFMSTLKPEYLSQIADDANMKLSKARMDMDPSDPRFLGTQVAALSLTISIELLGLYHKWLEQQL